ncbi:MAG: nuclear transport factor 2 family protein [Acidobacteriota bacterium]
MNETRKSDSAGIWRLQALAAVILLTCAANPTQLVAETQASDATALQVAQAFMGALGDGDMETLRGLMADDMVWHNEGDSRIPWIGPWLGKQAILEEFLPAFGSGAQAKMWSVEHASETDNEAAMTGRMSLLLTNSGVETGPTSWAVRVRVRNGQVTLWHWFEDSLLISRAFHGENGSKE